MILTEILTHYFPQRRVEDLLLTLHGILINVQFRFIKPIIGVGNINVQKNLICARLNFIWTKAGWMYRKFYFTIHLINLIA